MNHSASLTVLHLQVTLYHTLQPDHFGRKPFFQSKVKSYQYHYQKPLQDKGCYARHCVSVSQPTQPTHFKNG